MGKVIHIDGAGGGGGTGIGYIGIFANYNALIAAHPTAPLLSVAYVQNSQGTPWLPGGMGGTFYSKGTYLFDGANWVDGLDEVSDEIQDLIDEQYKAKVSNFDTTGAYLNSKIVGTTNKVGLTIINPAGNEQIKLNIGTDIFDKTVDDTDDITEGLNKFITAAELTKLGNIEAGADVTDAANVNAAGATMNTDTTLFGNSYFLDEDNMASDSPTKVASQQSIKAYVDNAIGSATLYNSNGTLTGNRLVDGDSNSLSITDLSELTLTTSSGGIDIGAVGGDVDITSDNDISLHGLKYPTADGGNTQVIYTDGLGNLAFQTVSQLIPANTITNALLDKMNANTVKVNNTAISNTPVDLAISVNTLLGRAAGNIVALTATQIRTIINVANGADVTNATNVNAAGATMNTDTTMAGNGYFLDEDTMSSNSATKVASQQSIKAYVDNAIPAVGGVIKSTEASRTANLGASQNNISTSGTSTIQFTGSGAGNVTGFANPENGKRLFVHCFTSFSQTYKHQSASSSAANRLVLGNGGADVVLSAGDSISFVYSQSRSRWIMESFTT